MGLFGKKKKEEKKGLPKLPELPKLPHISDSPEFPRLEPKGDLPEMPELPKLPSLPESDLGNDFSKNMIKEAVTGKKEVGAEADDLDDEDELPEFPRMPEPLDEALPFPVGFATPRRMSAEPVFVRLDKFEDSLNTFDKIKQKVTEAEKMLRDIRKVKEAEEVELGEWEKEIQTLKSQIAKVDADIFSKI